MIEKTSNAATSFLHQLQKLAKSEGSTHPSVETDSAEAVEVVEAVLSPALDILLAKKR